MIVEVILIHNSNVKGKSEREKKMLLPIACMVRSRIIPPPPHQLYPCSLQGSCHSQQQCCGEQEAERLRH